MKTHKKERKLQKKRKEKMKNETKQKRGFLFVTLTLLVLSAFNTTASAEPTVTLDPTSPYPQSSVTFTANIAGVDAANVYIVVQECNGNSGICYPDEINTSMTQKTADTYDATVTLKHSDATYIQYTLVAENNGDWTKYLELTKVTLSDKPTDNGDDSSSETPGFEFVGLAFSIMFISFILYRRKR